MSIMRLLFPGEEEEAEAAINQELSCWNDRFWSQVKYCAAILSWQIINIYIFSFSAFLSLFTLIKDGDTTRTKTFVGKTLYCFSLNICRVYFIFLCSVH